MTVVGEMVGQSDAEFYRCNAGVSIVLVKDQWSLSVD